MTNPRRQEDLGITRVLLMRTRPCPVSPHWDGLEWKRRALWYNERRNEVIAQAALALREQDMKKLRQLGVHVQSEMLPRGRVGKKVVVLVESTEHGEALLRLLPGWGML